MSDSPISPQLLRRGLWLLTGMGTLAFGLGLLLLVGFLLLLLWDGYRLPALGVLTLLCLGGGLALLQAAKRRLRKGEPMFAATRAEFERDQAALRPPPQ